MAEEVLIIGPYELKGRDLEEFLKFREEHIKSVKCYIDYEQGLPCFHEMVWLMKRFKERRCVGMIDLINSLLKCLYKEDDLLSVCEVDSEAGLIKAKHSNTNIKIKGGDKKFEIKFRTKSPHCDLEMSFEWETGIERDMGDLAKDIIKIAETLSNAYEDLMQKLGKEGYWEFKDK